MEAVTERVAGRQRAYVGVRGPDAEAFLQRMVSNDVAALAPGGACEALLLTAKARVIAPLVVLRRGAEDFLLLTEPELGETVRAHLVRMRLAAKAEVTAEEHVSVVVLGEPPAGVVALPSRELGTGFEVLDAGIAPTLSAEEAEVLRIEAGTPRAGREIDDRILPAEAGLDETAVSFTKGCYPGQEPVARLRHRGHANRGLRVLELDGGDPPGYDAEIRHEGKAVGRVTSAARRADGSVVCLGYVRAEVPRDAGLEVEGVAARQRVT